MTGQTEAEKFSGQDLKNIARCQSALCWLVFVRILMIAVYMNLTAFAPRGAALFNAADPILTSMLVVLSIVFSFFLAKFLRRKFAVFYSAGMIIPFVNLLVLLYLIIQSTRALRANGIRVGIMGARQEDLKQLTANG